MPNYLPTSDRPTNFEIVEMKSLLQIYVMNEGKIFVPKDDGLGASFRISFILSICKASVSHRCAQNLELSGPGDRKLIRAYFQSFISIQ